MDGVFQTHAGMSDPASFSDALYKRVQQQRSSVEKGVKRSCLGFRRTLTASTILARPCGYLGDVEVRGIICQDFAVKATTRKLKNRPK